MKKLALLTFMSFAMFAIVYTAIDSFNDSKTVIIPKSEMSQVEPNKNVELAKWMFERQANLKTGEINPEAIQAVYNQIASMNGVKSSMNLNWKFLGPSNIGGKVRAILIDKNNTDIIYAGGSSGGLWKSTTGGTSWKKVDYKGDEETGNIPNLFVNSLCQASNGDIYFGTGDYFSNPYGSTDLTFQGAGIWKSTDGKTFNRLKSTWSSSSSKNIFNYVIKLVAHPSDANTVYAATIKGLRVSKDGGETWTNAVKDANGNYIEDVCQSVAISADGKNMIVSFDGLVYVSNNSGSSSSWTLVSGDEDDLLPENSLRTEIAIAPSNKNVMYAQTTNEDQELLNIYRSTDGGKKWSVIGPGGSSSFNPLGTSGYYNNVIAVFPDNAEKIIVGGEQSLWSWSLSQGWNMLTMPIGGATSGMYVHQSQHDIKFNPNKPEVVFCASSGGVHRSVDGGVSWNTLNSNLAISQIVHFSYGNSNKILASSNEGGIVYLNPDKEVTSGLENEAEMLLDTDGGFCAISNIASEVFLISLPYGTLMRSEEYGGNMGGMYNMRISGKLGMENNNKFKHPYFIAGDLWESFYDKNSIETRQMIAPIDYPAGATVKVQSHIKEHYMSVVLDEPLLKGDTIETIDHYQTRLALGFRGSVWLTTQALDFTVEPDWKPIAYLNDEDDDYEMVNVLKWSADGAYIYFSTTRYQEDAISSILYRVGNFNDYREGTDR
ncbi:MAG: hypothetical protein GX879_01635, partial [Bacteroidales bacterium]|nr:hypothetical protein [Bacteroidales bacterium]